MKILSWFSLFFLLIPAGTTAAETSRTPEEKARAIEAKLIAPCCWTQPVSQHNSEVSNRMKQEIAEMVAAGRTESEILDRYVAEFGERVLASPRPRGFNRLVYILPWLAPIVGGLLLWAGLRRLQRKQTTTPEVPPGSPDPSVMDRLEKELREME